MLILISNLKGAVLYSRGRLERKIPSAGSSCSFDGRITLSPSIGHRESNRQNAFSLHQRKQESSSFFSEDERSLVAELAGPTRQTVLA